MLEPNAAATVAAMKSVPFLILAFALAACGDDASPPTVVDPGPFGGTPPTAEEFAAAPKTLPRAVLTPPSAAGATLGTPTSLQLPDLPASLAQGSPERKGSPGSCEVWSAGYVMGSYVAAAATGGGPLDLANTVSAGFVYAEVLAADDESCPKGTAAKTTLEYLVGVGEAGGGAPSGAEIGYSYECSYIESIDVGQTFTTDLSIGSWKQLPADASEASERIKEQLQAGYPAQFTLELPYQFLDYESGVFRLSDSCPQPGSGPACVLSKNGGFACVADASFPSGCSQHGIALVGYDDDRQAFWIQNSFGADWGENGRMWMSYDAFETIYVAGTIALPYEDVSTTTVTAHQAADPRASMASTRHLVLTTALADPLRIDTITIAPPEGDTVTQDFGHWFRTGTLHASRHDGLGWPAGLYEVSMTARDGTTVETTFELAAPAGVEVGPVSAVEVTGTNGRPVR